MIVLEKLSFNGVKIISQTKEGATKSRAVTFFNSLLCENC